MKTVVMAVGKPDAAMYLPACEEYRKRLERFLDITVTEIPESRIRTGGKEAVREEGARILEKLSPSDLVVALAIDGRQYGSAELAEKLDRWLQTGKKRLVFVIGGSDGLSEPVLERADEKLSVSKMTFPHQLARVILLEQLYRAETILNHITYHK